MEASKEESLALLRRSLERLGALEMLNEYSQDHRKWEHNTRNTISLVFGKNARHLQDFDAALRPYSSESEMYPLNKASAFRRVSRKVVTLLETMIEEVEMWEGAKVKEPSGRQSVFIIHGHDAGTKEEVARFISQLGLNPIILHEKANQGKAIIEKFEQHADVSFAIALLTPDDIGASKAQPEHLRSRPRQNVLFELGYVIGKLGRKFACGLVKGDVEILSDYYGVLYIEFDPLGYWRVQLIRELKAAGLEIDANTAF